MIERENVGENESNRGSKWDKIEVHHAMKNYAMKD